MMPFTGYKPEQSRYMLCPKCDVRWAMSEPRDCFVCGARGEFGPAFATTNWNHPMSINQRSYENMDEESADG